MSRDTAHVVLVGMMGSGKSTVGALLATRMGREFFDSDAVIVERAGCSVPEMFERSGESAFRVEEAQVVADLLADVTPSVISLGGGAVLHPTTRSRLASHHVVWLDAEEADLIDRLGSEEGRPMLSEDLTGDVRRLSRERRPLYAEVAGVVVDTTGRTAEEVCEAVAAEVVA